jgi:hypothetical protein
MEQFDSFFWGGGGEEYNAKDLGLYGDYIVKQQSTLT